MGKFINPFTDWSFKRISDITFPNNEILPEYQSERGVIYDIYCKTDEGEEFIVEMQNRSQIYFRERALFYLSRNIVKQGEKGPEWKFNLKAVYGVFLMNFKQDYFMPKLRTDIVLADRDTHDIFSDKLRFIFLELPCFCKEEEECDSNFDRWIYILKNMEIIDRMPFQARNAVFKKLESIVDIASLSKEERMKYDESIKVYRDNLVTMDYAIQKGLAEGREKGLAEGREKGLAEGRAEVARKLKQLSVSIDVIIQTTGLTQDEIEKL